MSTFNNRSMYLVIEIFIDRSKNMDHLLNLFEVGMCIKKRRKKKRFLRVIGRESGQVGTRGTYRDGQIQTCSDKLIQNIIITKHCTHESVTYFFPTAQSAAERLFPPMN
uniref:Uncharacterized protein n=1 Tax=Cacopsylla melanoneura TaxID=428564 RepID=A0A8D8S6Q0_9HEMI